MTEDNQTAIAMEGSTATYWMLCPDGSRAPFVRISVEWSAALDGTIVDRLNAMFLEMERQASSALWSDGGR